MFIKFTDYPRVINLDNFDELQLDDKGDYGASVIAIKYAPSIEGGAFTSSSEGISVLTIKYFFETEDAQRLYDAITDAWIGGEKVFEVSLEEEFDDEG